MPDNPLPLKKVKLILTFKFDLCNKDDLSLDLINGNDYDKKNAAAFFDNINSLYPHNYVELKKKNSAKFQNLKDEEIKPYNIEDPTWKYYNRSYLSVREPFILLDPSLARNENDTIFNMEHPCKELVVDEHEMCFDKKIRLYPQQGVISIILSYEFKNEITISQLINVYNIFHKERARGYFNYICKYKIAKKWLLQIIELEDKIKKNNDIKEDKEQEYISLFNLDEHIYDIVDLLREKLLTNDLKETDTNYHYLFESYRNVIVIEDNIDECFPFIFQDLEDSGSDDEAINKAISKSYIRMHSLLTGNKLSSALLKEDRQLIDESIQSYKNNFVLTGDWATVFLVHDTKNSSSVEYDGFEKEALFLYDFAHTLWFICQKWIYILPRFSNMHGLQNEIDGINERNQKEFKRKINYISKNETELRTKISHMQQSLIEVRDVDLMFFNSEYRRIMQHFYSSLKIMNHLDLVEYNLVILANCHRQFNDTLARKLNFESEKQKTHLSIVVGAISALLLVDFFTDFSVSIDKIVTLFSDFFAFISMIVSNPASIYNTSITISKLEASFLSIFICAFFVWVAVNYDKISMWLNPSKNDKKTVENNDLE